MRTYTPHYNGERCSLHMPLILRTFIPIEKEDLLSASCRYFPQHSKKETGSVLTLILACGSQAARSPALALSTHHNDESYRLPFHMPLILRTSPR